LTAAALPWCDARTRVADLGSSTSEETVTMETTPTMAGLMAPAGAARPVTFAPVAPAARPSRHRLTTTWIAAASAHPATFKVLDGKNRLPRPPSEPSP
jgi:hypothetical protein